MAADFATAPSVVSPPNFQQQVYGQGVQFTPSHPGAATPANVSPTSPRTNSNFAHLHHLTRQLRPPKSPLYVPAALRPTEKPTKSSPPKSGDSNLDSVDSGIAGLGRYATGGSIDSGISRIGSDEYLEEARGKVTGEPTRNHWKPDNASLICDASSCQKPFSFFERRHHCRRCGGVFCAEHSSRKVKLNQNALFHPDAAFYRSCDRCFALYRQWQHRRDSDTNTESDSQGSNPVGVGPAHIPANASAADGFKVGSLAQSAPRDWQWSTF